MNSLSKPVPGPVLDAGGGRSDSKSARSDFATDRIDQRSKQTASAIIGGGMFIAIGLYVRGYVHDFGLLLAGMGVIFWLFGLTSFFALTRFRPGWLGVLFRVHATGLLTILGLLVLAGPLGGEYVIAASDFLAQRTPPWLGGPDGLLADYYMQAFEGLVMLIFGWECTRLSAFCRRFAGTPSRAR